MLSTFRVTVRMLLRTPSALVWALAFPIIMSTLFIFMFSGMRTAECHRAGARGRGPRRFLGRFAVLVRGRGSFRRRRG